MLDGFGVQALVFSMAAGDEELGYLSQGLRPETYTHVIDGVKQDGVFLGKANVTTWAFKFVTKPANFYQVRLMGPGNGTLSGKDLHDGEFMGFLKVVSPY